MLSTSKSILRTLILLSLLFLGAQILFAALHFSITGMIDITHAALSFTLFFSRSVFPAIVFFIAAQIALYVFFIYVIWFVALSMGELFSLRQGATRYLAIVLWLLSVLAIVAMNTYFVSHSIFTQLIREDIFSGRLTDSQLQWVMMTTLACLGASFLLALVSTGLQLAHSQHRTRNLIMLSTLFILAWVMTNPLSMFQNKSQPVNSPQKPNIIIIGFDALRPDYLSFFNDKTEKTPTFDHFLSSAVVFPDAYTPLARTLPSWTSILMGQYPLHDHVRENNTFLDEVNFTQSLPKRFQDAGYETIYATDDRRFNTIDFRYGFNHIVGPQGAIADFLVGTLNDFPLSNLLVPTRLGRMLFPYSHGNHGAYPTYDPANFLSLLQQTINAQHKNHPLFLAVHFDLSGWPCYWFNDKLAYNAPRVAAYQRSIIGDDVILSRFLSFLNEKGFLENAIVVLLSDHGVTLGLHGDRSIKAPAYQGDPAKMKVMRERYSDAIDAAAHTRPIAKRGDSFVLHVDANAPSPLNATDFGVDTSYGYGGDLLSLNQTHTLFAIKSFGHRVKFVPHRVEGRSMLFDLAPTLLDVLQLPPLSHADGISLRPYLYASRKPLPDRPLFFESAYSIAEIEQRDIVYAKVLAQSMRFFYINPKTGTVALYPPLMKILIGNKQRSVLWGDWLLAYYPESERFRFVRAEAGVPNETGILIRTQISKDKKVAWTVAQHKLPPYFVLLNVKTGEWTTEESTPWVTRSPLSTLRQSLDAFYGREMENYS